MSPMDSQFQVRMRSNQPCAACRMLRRRCSENCLLAPYFPADEADNFARVHKVFGASNVIKILQMVEETQREDTVKSMVYEARARLQDPVYGCAGIIFCLQKHVRDLQEQLELTKSEFIETQVQRENLLKILMDVDQFNPKEPPINDVFFDSFDLVLDDSRIGCDPYDYSMDFSGSLESSGLHGLHGQTSCSTY